MHSHLSDLEIRELVLAIDLSEHGSGTDQVELLKKLKCHRIKHNIHLGSSSRHDVIFKSFLRALRKHYLDEFNSITNFKKSKSKNKDLIVSLARYVKYFLGKSPISKILSVPMLTQLTVGLVLVLGAIFYPKEMAKYYSSESVRETITMINRCLYRFALKNMDYLYQWDAYKVLVHHFTAQKMPHIASSFTLTGAINDDYK